MENPNGGAPQRSMNTLLDVMLGVKPRSSMLPNAPVGQFLDGDAAWIVSSEEELLDTVASGDNPLGLRKSTTGMYFKKAALCCAGIFAIAVVASQLQYRTPEFVDTFFTFLFAIAFIMMCYYGVRFVVSLFTQNKWNKERSFKQISSALGAPWKEKLAVAVYRPEELNPYTREVVDHMRLLYAMADAQGLPMSASQWRSLTSDAVQATDLYFQTGDTTLAQIVRDQVDILVPYRKTW